MEDIAFAELRGRLGEDGLVVVDVRTAQEFTGAAGAPCDPRQGHIEGARNLPLARLLECRSVDEILALVALPEGVEIIAYCHSGQRSAFAVQVLREAGYRARNYAGSWHEWSRDPSLPCEPVFR